MNSLRELGLKESAASGEEPGQESQLVVTWLKRLGEARKTEKDFRKEARRVVSIYEAEKKEENEFNILFSNTETMAPALYNSTPRPRVSRRFKDESPKGKACALVVERLLVYLTDNGNPEYTDYDDLMKSATLEALVPGRGVTWFKYDATTEKAENLAAAEGAEPPEASESDDEIDDPVAERVAYETVCGEEVPWDRFLHGAAKKWKDVPWVSREHYMTREELEENFGKLGGLVPVAELEKTGHDSDSDDEESSALAGMKVATVYEIWDKVSKKVLFISPGYKQAPLREVEDPLKLAGFLPCPKPLSFFAKITNLTPVPLYTTYESQAKELNRITVRINKLIAALKVRGMYDSTVEGIGKVLAADDNVLVPAENVAALLSQGNALEKAIWLMPIEKLITVLQQLYLQRQQVKTVIYEITGIADIMRGSSQASETLGAQQLKNQWGTLRLKRSQKEVARYARDCLRLMAEIAVSKLSIETIKAMTGLDFPMMADKQQAQMQLQQMQGQAQQMAQMAQMQGQQPPAPQPPPPQLLAAASAFAWEELLETLQNDMQRGYQIDIETNSTVDAEATDDKKDISELLNALSQFFNGVGPLVQDGTMPFEVAQQMLLAVTRRFTFGPELEDALKKMKPPEQKPDPAAEATKLQTQSDMEMAKIDMQGKQMDLKGKEALLQMQMQQAQQDAAFSAQEHQMKMAELERKADLAMLQHRQKMQQAMMPKPAVKTPTN